MSLGEHPSKTRCSPLPLGSQEIPSASPQVPICTVGRLRQSIGNWEKLVCPNWILEGIRNGFRLPMSKKWASRWGQNRFKNEEEVLWWEKELASSLESGARKLWTGETRAISSVHLVPKKGPKKFRAVVNMRGVNKGMDVPKIKFEHLQSIIPYLVKGDWMITFDLSQGYTHLHIHPSDWDLLAFEYNGQVFVHTALPFGISVAPFLFTKVVKVMVNHWRALGIRVFHFIDDFLVLNSSKEGLQRDREVIRTTLAELGWITAEEKCCWEPALRATYLGLLIDTAVCRIEVPEEKLVRLLHKVEAARQKSVLRRRSISRIAGLLVSIQLAFHPAKFVARGLYSDLGLEKLDMPWRWWEEKVSLSEMTKEDLSWFAENARKWNGREFLLPELTSQILLQTDASTSGLGAVLEDDIIKDVWSGDDLDSHIGEKELKTVLVAMTKWRKRLRGTKLRVRTDNKTVLSYLLKAGGKKPVLNALAREIWHICLEENILLLTPYWIRSEDNQFTDGLSRGADSTEWVLKDEVFRMLEDKWGKFDVDCFASDINRKCDKFYAATEESGRKAAGIDAFTKHWGDQRNYVLCPFQLIPRVLKHAEECKAYVVIVVPIWKSQPWWAKIESLAVEQLMLPSGPVCFGGLGAEPLKNLSWKFMAVKLQF